MRRGIVKIISAALAALFILASSSGCVNEAGAMTAPHSAVSPFASFRDVPGVTEDEKRDIEALRERVDVFVYGMPLSTEAFEGENGEVRGYTALFCEWLTEFFGIPFKPKLYDWLDLLAGLESGEVSFTGELTASDARLKIYRMTNAIASRPLKYYRLAGGRPFADIIKERPLRCGFIEGTSTIYTVSAELEPGTFENVLLSDVSLVYDALKSGDIDAFYYTGTAEANFVEYSDLIALDFYPLIYRPVSLTTQTPELQPIISVVEKVLENGGMRHLTALYNEGQQEYLKYKLYTQLTEEERVYVKNHSVVPIGVDPGNYPGSFYDKRERTWQGIFLDILEEVSSLTGLSFERVNDEYTDWPVIYQMLTNGEVAIVPELTRTREREGRFLWPDTVEMIDHYALISKYDYRNIKINEILYVKVGVAKNTAYTDIFRKWFPNHMNTVEYESMEEAFDALRSGEVDMVMANEKRLLYLTHYLELPGYKVNVGFNQALDINFGFNKDEAVLCSIIDKALKIVDTTGITDQWMRRTYDYRVKVVEAQRPLLIGAIALSLIVLALILIMFYRNHGEGKRLAKLVEEQTAELTAASAEAKNASETKSRFIANMSHEMRTPMNVIVGLTDLMLEDSGISDATRDELIKINTAGHTLMGLITDILDISKIEAGKLELMPVKYELLGNVMDIITLSKIRLEDKPVTFVLDIDGTMPQSLFGDDLRIKQILNNLLSNAFKYTHEGTVTLRCRYRRDGDCVWADFTISDTGIGIRKDDMAKLFTDYNQVDTRANRKIEGTGLGLSITKKLIDLMDGDMSVESEYGKGTTFRVRIRQGFVSDATLSEETLESLRGFRYSDKNKSVPGKLARPDLSYAKVLVVDDYPSNLDVAARMLRKYKMRVDCIDNGGDAVRRIAAGEPVYDAVFMDHMMPEMDGMEATAHIRALGTKYAENIPIIALTANAVAGNEQMFLENGFNAFLPKPFNVKNLDSVIQRWVRDKSRE